MATQVVSVNFDRLKSDDRKFVCWATLDNIKSNRARLYPSKYGGNYWTIIIMKDREIDGKKISKNTKLIVFGKQFQSIIARAKTKVQEQVSYYQANLAS